MAIIKRAETAIQNSLIELVGDDFELEGDYAILAGFSKALTGEDKPRPLLYGIIWTGAIGFSLWAFWPSALVYALFLLADVKYEPSFEGPNGEVLKPCNITNAELERMTPYDPATFNPVSSQKPLGASETYSFTPSANTALHAVPVTSQAVAGSSVSMTRPNTKSLLSQILQSPFANRAFIGAQRTGKSGLVAVAGQSLAAKGITFYQINLACYSENGTSEDDAYTRHIHPSNTVRGDIALARDREEVQQLVDRATSLVHDWFATRNSILIVDEWFSLASKSIEFAEVTYPLAQLIAGKLAHLTSAGTKRGLALWLITPQAKAGGLTEAGKDIKQCKLCYVGIAPGKSIQWRGDLIKWDAELFEYVKKNFPVDYPKGRSIQGEDRIGFVNDQWLPLGTTQAHFEEMSKAPKAVLQAIPNALEKEPARAADQPPRPAMYGADIKLGIEPDLEIAELPKVVTDFISFVEKYFEGKNDQWVPLGTLIHSSRKLREKIPNEKRDKVFLPIIQVAVKAGKLNHKEEKGTHYLGVDKPDLFSSYNDLFDDI